MKFLKSIFIFFVFLSISGLFYYTLRRINRNMGYSIIFTPYALDIKIGLIGPNLAPKLNQNQLVKQPINRVVYNSYGAIKECGFSIS